MFEVVIVVVPMEESGSRGRGSVRGVKKRGVRRVKGGGRVVGGINRCGRGIGIKGGRGGRFARGVKRGGNRGK